MRRFAAGVAVGGLLGWLAVPETVTTETETVVLTTPMPAMSAFEEAQSWETPIADALVDWEQVERDTDCLWELLQEAQVEITLEVVLAFGTWADAQGGPCVMTGTEGTDEEQG